MSEREEKLITKINKLQRIHNSLKIDGEIGKYKKEIKETEKDIENTKTEINKLSSILDELENNSENDSSSIKEKNIEEKKNLLNNILNENNLLNNQLNILKFNAENYKNQNFINSIIQYWTPETMFKFIRAYDKKSE